MIIIQMNIEVEDSEYYSEESKYITIQSDTGDVASIHVTKEEASKLKNI